MIIAGASRLEQVQEYFFSKKLKEIARLRSEGKPIINLGIGSPDLPPPPEVVAELKNGAERTDSHGYQPYTGIPELRQSIAAFSKAHYDLMLADAEILPLMGSKEGITHISLAFLNPGDRVLIPSIGYPTYTSVTRMVGAEPVYYPLIEESGWEPDWGFLESLNDPKIKLLWLNYPHMPTGTPASTERFSRFVRWAREKRVLLCHDNPYSFISNQKPMSLLALEGAMDVAIELNSLSKTFNMAGWRVGWLAGREEYLGCVTRVKTNMDSGMFKPIQLAAIKALNADKSWFQALDKTYSGRLEIACQILMKLKCEWREDQSGMFVWAKTPDGDGERFSDRLLSEKHVFITPGKVFGEAGQAYIRISLCSPVEVFNEVLNRL